MIPQSANHDHIRKMYFDAMTKQEHEEAQRTMRALLFAFLYAGAVIALIAWIQWR